MSRRHIDHTSTDSRYSHGMRFTYAAADGELQGWELEDREELEAYVRDVKDDEGAAPLLALSDADLAEWAKDRLADGESPGGTWTQGERNGLSYAESWGY